MIREAIQEILEELRYQNTSDALWDVADIARYMRLSKSTIHSCIISRQDFPRAVRVPTSKTGLGGRRWFAKEVKQWTTRHRDPVKLK